MYNIHEMFNYAMIIRMLLKGRLWVAKGKWRVEP